jgi:class 3 adenylate cyclase
MSTHSGTILIVDDDALGRMLLEAQLQEMGHQVLTAEDGKRALDILSGHGVDVVLLDLVMPNMDGFEVLRRMKQDVTLRHLPIIVISAQEDMGVILQCIEMGATDYLPKPFDPVLLRARVNASMASKRLRDLELSHLQALQVERERADMLLLNILPPSIADQLKLGRRVIAESFPDATVLFADLVGFTRLAARREPAEVVEMLNTLFTAFDELTDRFGVEKIKTIGDAYMAAGGLPIPRKGHVEAVADLALAMRAECTRLAEELRLPLQLRLGIHSGPVTAGVIGNKKFIYDLWGDTVNIASRMESQGLVDGIQVSDVVYERLRDRYRFQDLGRMTVKGRGQMQTYLLLGGA